MRSLQHIGQPQSYNYMPIIDARVASCGTSAGPVLDILTRILVLGRKVVTVAQPDTILDERRRDANRPA